MKKLIALCLAAAVCFSFVGCGTPDAAETTSDVASDAVVMTVGDTEITADLLASYITNNKVSYEMYYLENFGQGDTSALWEDPDTCSMILENAKSQIIFDTATVQLAAELGLVLSDENRANMETTKETYIAQLGSEEAFLEYIHTMGFRETEFDKILEAAEYQRLIEDYYYGENGQTPVSEEDIQAYYNDHYYRAKHILIKTVDDAFSPLGDDEIAEKEALVNDLVSRANSGENFDALIAKYGEDPGMETSPNGYTFSAEDNFVSEFIDGTVALGVNEISGAVESAYGFHIIQRLPLLEDTLYAEDGSVSGTSIYDAIRSSLADVSARINDYINDKITVTVHEEIYDKITVQNAGSLLE